MKTEEDDSAVFKKMMSRDMGSAINSEELLAKHK